MDEAIPDHLASRSPSRSFNGNWREGLSSDGLVLESWAQGFEVGALIIMACVTVANMRKGVLLHKLILLEVGVASTLFAGRS